MFKFSITTNGKETYSKNFETLAEANKEAMDFINDKIQRCLAVEEDFRVRHLDMDSTIEISSNFETIWYTIDEI